MNKICIQASFALNFTFLPKIPIKNGVLQQVLAKILIFVHTFVLEYEFRNVCEAYRVRIFKFMMYEYIRCSHNSSGFDIIIVDHKDTLLAHYCAVQTHKTSIIDP